MAVATATAPKDFRGAVSPVTNRGLQGRAGRFGRQHLIFAVLLVALIGAALAALAVGRYPVPLSHVWGILWSPATGAAEPWSQVEANTVLNTRLPRVLAALLIGAALSEAGAAYQAIFKNPMVSPDLLGVSSGACVGAAVAIVLGLGALGTQVLAFVVAVGAVALATLIPRLFKNTSILMLVLAGVVVSGFMSSVLGYLKFIADPDGQLADIVFWTMGSLNGVKKQALAACAPVMLICGIGIFLVRWRLNVLALGDAQAHYLGTRSGALRLVVIGCATLMTASAVCLSGTIGWVGLVVPHMARLIIGQDNRFVIPASALVGAGFLLVADTLSRTLSAMSIPLSVITGLVGAPLFVILLLARRREVR